MPNNISKLQINLTNLVHFSERGRTQFSPKPVSKMLQQTIPELSPETQALEAIELYRQCSGAFLP